MVMYPVVVEVSFFKLCVRRIGEIDELTSGLGSFGKCA